MKLRSDLTVGMNPDTKTIKRAADSLRDVFKRGEILTASDNCDDTEIISKATLLTIS